MPRETTHYLVARRLLNELSRDDFWREYIDYPNCTMLGAVFPDVLYYSIFAKPGPEILQLPDHWHGVDGEETLLLVKCILQHVVTNDQTEASVAFLIGIISHIYSDITFHALVYFLTGNTFSTNPSERSLALRRHRRFETLIDLYMKQKYPACRKELLQNFLLGAECTLEELVHPIAETFIPESPEKFTAVLESSYRLSARAQKFYNSSLLARIAFSMEKLLPLTLREYSALFSAPQLQRILPKLEGTLNYRDPFSGDERQDSLDQLLNRAIEKSLTFLQIVKKILSGALPLDKFTPEALPEVCGLIVHISDMKYYSRETTEEISISAVPSGSSPGL